jgi:hypothetical protein
MSSRKKHLRTEPRGRWQYIYDGRRLLGVVEEHEDGKWHVIIDHIDVGACATRESALKLVDEIERTNAARGGRTGENKA